MKKLKDDMIKLFWAKCIEYTNNLKKSDLEDEDSSWLNISSAYKAGSKAVIDYIFDNYDIYIKKPKNNEYCKCEIPDRESGFSYCNNCHKHVSDARMRFLVDKNEMSKEPAKEEDLNKINGKFEINTLCARATLYPGKTIEEVR